MFSWFLLLVEIANPVVSTEIKKMKLSFIRVVENVTGNLSSTIDILNKTS